MAKIHWKTGVSGDFNDASAWSGNAVPGFGDDALITASGQYIVTELGTNVIHKLRLAAGAELLVGATGNLRPLGGIANAGTILVVDGTLLLEGKIVNSGSITASRQFGMLSGQLQVVRAVLTGGGVVTLRDNTSVTPVSATATTTLINVNNTIEGSGTIGQTGFFGTLNLVNRAKGVIDSNSNLALNFFLGDLKNAGLIEASGTSLINVHADTIENSGSVVFGDGMSDVGATSVTNSGSIAATGKGAVAMGGLTVVDPTTIVNTGAISETGGGSLGVFGGTIDNSTNGNSGVLEVSGAQSVFKLGNVATFPNLTIIGGALTASNGGIFTVGNLGNATVTLDGTSASVTLTGPLADTGGTLVLKGTISNHGTISGGVSQLEIGPSGAVLDGGGAVTLDTGATVKAIQADATLTNVDNTISGTGNIGVFLPNMPKLSIANQVNGVIDANQALSISLADLNNAGLIDSSGIGALKVAASTIENSGKLMLGGNGMDVISATVVSNSGSIAATGTGLAFQFLNATASVANIGTISVTGGGTLLAGPTIDNFATISVAGGSKLEIGAMGAAQGTLDGGGAILLSNATLSAAASSLVNVDNTISGSGEIGAGHAALTNGVGGVIDATGSQVLDINIGQQTLTNAGTIEATASGGLTIEAAKLVNTGTIDAVGGNVLVGCAVTGAGSAMLGDGAALTFAAAATPNVSFVDDTVGVLRLDTSANFTGTLTGFGAANMLDLADLSFTSTVQASFSGTAAGGTLVVSNGAATDQYQLVGDYTQVGFNVAADGTGGTRVFEAGSAFGTSGNDTLIAGPTATTLVGLGGTDNYQVAKTGAGTVEVLNGVASSTQPAGELLFGPGVADTQLWLDRVDNNGAVQATGNNLRLDVMGTPQSVRIDGWYNPATPSAQLSDVKLTDGGLKLDNAVAGLVAAMATFEASHPGFDPAAPANSTITDPIVLAAVQSSWHM